jgi:hypothetical protein
MGIMDVDLTLPANRLIFTLRRDMALLQRFLGDIDSVMDEYGLSADERRALREADIRALAGLGVHPYFLPQVVRLFHSGAYNHNDSEAARVYASQMVEGYADGEEAG